MLGEPDLYVVVDVECHGSDGNFHWNLHFHRSVKYWDVLKTFGADPGISPGLSARLTQNPSDLQKLSERSLMESSRTSMGMGRENYFAVVREQTVQR